MAILLTARGLGHAFASRPLFSGVSFTISDGDRIGLIGPNGAGKSTLLEILAGELVPDQGEIIVRAGVAVGYLPQEPRFAEGATVREAVRAGLPGADRPDAALEPSHEARVDELLGKLELNAGELSADRSVHELSGGWQKRVALARALASDPQLLLLDEPTNHLDVESIEWLERFLAQASLATVTVTHDRYFLQRVARRILELDRRNAGGLLDVQGDYATYVERKAEAMAAQEKQEQRKRNLLRRETEWLRRGPAARSTKQAARIERAAELAAEVAELGMRNDVRRADLELASTGRRTRKLVEAKAIAKRYGGRTVFAGVDLALGPGSRIALMGPNGCGKSTLLRVLIGREPPSEGTVVHAPGIVTQVFEQDRACLDPDVTLADSIASGSDFVDFRGTRLHRHGYLERFLFRADQMRVRVGSLSGGEQSRLLIARLMLRPADVLVLDEPTNDLDFETLDVLQDALESFEGALLLVSHDRYFVDQVATELLAFHTAPGELGRTTRLADLHQWQAFHAQQLEAARARPRAPASRPEERAAPGAPRPRKLGYKDQRDWDTLEARITAAEAELAGLEREIQRPDVASDAARVLELDRQMTALRGSIDALYAHWAELEAKLAGGA